jgi:glutathione peroxidase
MSVYQFNVQDNQGKPVSLEQFSGKPLLIVNTASKCGFTPQYEQLQALYDQYAEKGLVILAFPCNQFAGQEPGSADEISEFCSLNYGVTFPLMAKLDVRGESADPLFKYLSDAQPFNGFDAAHPITERLMSALQTNFPEYLEGNGIKWNFTKFLVDGNGNVVERYEPTTEPKAIAEAIEKLL